MKPARILRRLVKTGKVDVWHYFYLAQSKVSDKAQCTCISADPLPRNENTGFILVSLIVRAARSMVYTASANLSPSAQDSSV